ncbi:MAG: histidinol-phosphate transaminase [Leptothrix ochracea]|uniref:histidinol-phosphate transaminase n=1 Tax=Leptothrix ochracea TaxID=735331 RepID=UPI0034E2FB10
MSRYWSAVVHQLKPYVPGEQPKLANLIKLNTNENPYPPSPQVLAAIQAELGDDASRLRLYPDPGATGLRATLARQHGLQPAQVFVGNGSDEVLAHIFLALLKHEDAAGQPRPLLFPDVTYSFYPTYCLLYGVTARTLALDEQLGLHLDDYIAQADAGAVIFPNPNAPTGRGVPLADVERLLLARPDMVVVVDEAYVDFGAESAATLVDRFPNLVVVHTFSKSRSLAGMRVGYALAQVPLIEALERVKDSFNSYPLDRLALAAAQAAVEDEAYFEQTRQAVMRSRDWLRTELTKLGFEVLPSQANFVFARHPQHSGAALQQVLREHAIIVRHFRQPERIAPYLRITIGTDAECQALVQALVAALKGSL